MGPTSEGASQTPPAPTFRNAGTSTPAPKPPPNFPPSPPPPILRTVLCGDISYEPEPEPERKTKPPPILRTIFCGGISYEPEPEPEPKPPPILRIVFCGDISYEPEPEPEPKPPPILHTVFCGGISWPDLGPDREPEPEPEPETTPIKEKARDFGPPTDPILPIPTSVSPHPPPSDCPPSPPSPILHNVSCDAISWPDLEPLLEPEPQPQPELESQPEPQPEPNPEPKQEPKLDPCTPIKVETPHRGNQPPNSPWLPAALGTATVVLLALMGSHIDGPLRPACGSSAAASDCHANNSADAVGCVLGPGAEDLVSDVSRPTSRRQGCQSACTLADYAEASPLTRDVLVSRGAVAAVVGRLTSLGQDDRPTALSLLGALRPLCANSSLALRALHAAGGLQALEGLAGRFASDSFVLATINVLQQLLFPSAPSDSPSVSPSLSPSPSSSPSPSPSPNASPSPSLVPSEPPASDSPANWSLSPSPVPNQSSSASPSPSSQPSSSLIPEPSPVPSSSPSSRSSASPKSSPSPLTSHSPGASEVPSQSISSSPSLWPSPGSAVVNFNHSLWHEPSISFSSSPKSYPSHSPGSLPDQLPSNDDCWEQCEQLDNSTTGENSFSDDSAEPDEPEQLGPGDVADCPSHDLTTVLFALFLTFSTLSGLIILLVVFGENWAAARALKRQNGDVAPTPVPPNSLRRPYTWLVKLLLNHVQVLCLLGTITMPWPTYVGIPLGALNAVFNADLNFLAFRCFTGLGEVGQVIVYLCVPVAMALLAAVPVAVLWLSQRCCRRTEDGDGVWRSVTGKLTALLLLVGYIIYPVSLRHCIAFMWCSEGEGGVAECLSNSRLGLYVASAVSIAAWGVLLPSLLLWMLLQHLFSSRLQTTEVVDRLGWLFAGYQPSAWYWEFVVHFRKVAICVVVASKRPTPEVQLTAMLGLIGLALPMHFAVSPHEDKDMNQLETNSLVTLFLTSWLGLMYAQVSDLLTTVALSIALLLVNVLCLLFFVLTFWGYCHGVPGAENKWFRCLISAWMTVVKTLGRQMEDGPETRPRHSEIVNAPESPKPVCVTDHLKEVPRLLLPKEWGLLEESVRGGSSARSGSVWDDSVAYVADSFLGSLREHLRSNDDTDRMLTTGQPAGVALPSLPPVFPAGLLGVPDPAAPGRARRGGPGAVERAPLNAPGGSPHPLHLLSPLGSLASSGGGLGAFGDAWKDSFADITESFLGRSKGLPQSPSDTDKSPARGWPSGVPLPSLPPLFPSGPPPSATPARAGPDPNPDPDPGGSEPLGSSHGSGTLHLKDVSRLLRLPSRLGALADSAVSDSSALAEEATGDPLTDVAGKPVGGSFLALARPLRRRTPAHLTPADPSASIPPTAPAWQIPGATGPQNLERRRMVPVEDLSTHSCQSLYLYYCNQYRVAPNKAVKTLLSTSMGDFHSEDISLGPPPVFLGDRGLLPLLEVVRVCQSLASLRLPACGLHTRGGEWLAEALQDHDTLRLVDLRGNAIGDVAVGFLLQLACAHPRLTSVDVTGTRANAALVDRLEAQLQANREAAAPP